MSAAGVRARSSRSRARRTECFSSRPRCSRPPRRRTSSRRYPIGASQRAWKRWRRVSPQRRDDVMLAIDTNLVARYLTGDHPSIEKAKAVIDGEEVFVSTTVMLEAEWVLRSAYG